MKHSLVSASVLCLAVVFAVSDSTASSPKSNGKRSVSVSQQVACSPSAVASPVAAVTPMSVCVSGYAEGNFVTVNVPWVGTVDNHSNIGFSKYVDSTGGFCITAPPDWTSLSLAPGTYNVEVYWYQSGSSSTRNESPAGTFTVTSN